MVILLYSKYDNKDNIDYFITKYLEVTNNFVNIDSKININIKISDPNDVINYYKEKIPKIFVGNKIKVHKSIYEELISFLKNMDNNYKPIFYTLI